MLIHRKEKKQCKQKSTSSTMLQINIIDNVANFPKPLTAIYVKKPKVRGVENMLKFLKV